MKTLLSFAILLLLSSFSISSKENTAGIPWSSERKLVWSDFTGSVNPDSHADAGTAIQISAKPYRSKGKVRYEVSAYFLPEKSWRREESDALLAHEQLHFDIAELYARKIRKNLYDLERKGVKDPKVFHQAIERLLKESDSIDASYDRITLHGCIDEKQKLWAANIAYELSALKDFQ